MTPPTNTEGAVTDVAAIARGLTRGQREMMKGRHDERGNPWPFISITQRSGGAKARTFAKMQATGLYDRGNHLTPLGLAVHNHLTEQGVTASDCVPVTDQEMQR